MVTLNSDEQKILEIFYNENENDGYIDLWRINEISWLEKESDELYQTIRYLYDHSFLEWNWHSGGWIFRISSIGKNVFREVLSQWNKTKWDTILERCNKQSPLWPFLSILISVWAAIVSIIALLRNS